MDCHCEPFAFCHSDPESNEGEESRYFAQGKLREAIRRSRCEGIARGNLKSSLALLGTRLRRYTPRNDDFSMTLMIVLINRVAIDEDTEQLKR